MTIFDERFYNDACGCCGNCTICRNENRWCDEARTKRAKVGTMSEEEKQRLRDAHFCIVDCSTDNQGRNILP